MNRLAFLALLLVGSAAADVQIRLPDTAPPPVAPTPELIPPTVQKLGAGVFYMIDSNTQLIVLSSPAGLVKVTVDEGPNLKIGGWFVDGTGEHETRKYTSKYVYTVQAIGKGRVELLIVPVGVTDESKIVRRTVDVDNGQGPRPPPGPDPSPPPPPVPGGMRVLMVYETADLGKLPSSQLVVLHGQAVREYLNQKCVKGPDGKTADWRLWDAHVSLENEREIWRNLMARPRTSLPWVHIVGSKKDYSGSLPTTIEEMMTLLKSAAE